MNVPKNEEVQYQMMLSPRIPLDMRDYKGCIAGFTHLPGFTQGDRGEGKIEYKYLVNGRRKCRLLVTRENLTIETYGDGVCKEDWRKWRESILEIVGEGMEWVGQDIALLAIVHKYRFQKREGNNYEFLRDTLLGSSNTQSLFSDLPLLDLDLTLRGRLTDKFNLLINVTSNQTSTEILDGALDDDDNEIIFEFHCFRTDVKDESELVMLALAQEEILEAWLQDGVLDKIRKRISS